MEVTFEEARAHLGMETQRQWNDRAIARTTPALLSLYSIITLTAQPVDRFGFLRLHPGLMRDDELCVFATPHAAAAFLARRILRPQRTRLAR